MRSKRHIKIDLQDMRAVKSGFIMQFEMYKRDLLSAEQSVKRCETEIKKLNEELYLTRLIDFCNTPCWRFVINN